MLSQRRRRGPYTRPALAIFDRGVDHLDGAALLVVHLDDHAPRAGVLVVKCALDVVDGRVWHPPALKDVQPLLRRFPGADLLDRGLEFFAVGHARRVDAVFGVSLPLRPAQAIAEDAEQAVVAATEEDVPVLSLEGLVRDDRCCTVLATGRLLEDAATSPYDVLCPNVPNPSCR